MITVTWKGEDMSIEKTTLVMDKNVRGNKNE